MLMPMFPRSKCELTVAAASSRRKGREFSHRNGGWTPPLPRKLQPRSAGTWKSGSYFSGIVNELTSVPSRKQFPHGLRPGGGNADRTTFRRGVFLRVVDP